MTPPDDMQRTIGGLAGKAVGTVKAVLSGAADTKKEERTGRLPEAQAEVRAAPDRLAKRVSAERREH